MKYICPICSYEYDSRIGDEENGILRVKGARCVRLARLCFFDLAILIAFQCRQGLHRAFIEFWCPFALAGIDASQ